MQEKKGSSPFSKGEAGFDVEDYIEKVVALLPDEKAKQYRDAHPTDEQLLEKPIPVSLPDKIEMPQGLENEDKAPYITDFIDEIPNAQYSSLIVSLLDIVKTHEKKLKSFGIVKAEELRKMKAEYENFVLAYHRGGIDGFRKYSNYTLTRPFWSIVYNYHFLSLIRHPRISSFNKSWSHTWIWFGDNGTVRSCNQSSMKLRKRQPRHKP